MKLIRIALLLMMCLPITLVAAHAKTQQEMIDESNARNKAALERQKAGAIKEKPIPTPKPKPKATPQAKTPDNDDTDNDSTSGGKSKKSSSQAVPEDPYEDQRWTENDVKKFCVKKASGPRAYDSCLERNSRRIGRAKDPYDANMLNE